MTENLSDNNEEFILVLPDNNTRIFKRTGNSQTVRINLPTSLIHKLKSHFDIRTLNNTEDILWNWNMLGALQRWLYEKEIMPAAQQELDNFAETLRQKSQTEQLSDAVHRLEQEKLRSVLIAKYHQCMINGIKEKKLLVASHIKEWHECESAQDRLDIDNTLLLSVAYDALFDKHYITFHPDTGKMMKSDRISEDTLIRLGVPINWRETISIKNYLTERRSQYLNYHYSKTIT